MSLAEQSQKWLPTHVQATVLQAKDLRPKGKNGTNDAYTIIQLGKEKYSTSVAEKTLNPIWKEEASFELPGLLHEGNHEIYELSLIVMHRSLVGIDKFLGQKMINLNEIFDNKERRKTDWFILESKSSQKRKDRGKIQVSIQFMRNNMTASMFDLSIKDKPRSPFSKLKDKMKGHKHDGLSSDTFSAILPRSAVCDADSQSGTGRQPQLRIKPKRSQLLGPQKLSAAHSMSDLIGPRSSTNLESVNTTEKSHGDADHRRSQSEVHGYDASEAHADPFNHVADVLPQKYATLPRNHNPFDSEQRTLWDRKEKKEKVSLLERVTGKKDIRKVSNGSRSGSSGDLHAPNPFSNEAEGETNPFNPHYKISGNLKKPTSNEDINSIRTTSSHRKENIGKKNDSSRGSETSYSNLSFDEVVQELIKQKEVVKKKDAHIRELEDYIDDLLVRVMEETPSILRKPYEPKKKAGKFSKK